MYMCENCRKKIEKLNKFVTCPHCGHKIVSKERPPLMKRIKAE